jgi:hypothetical protein
MAKCLISLSNRAVEFDEAGMGVGGLLVRRLACANQSENYSPRFRISLQLRILLVFNEGNRKSVVIKFQNYMWQYR